jgi:transposase
VVPQNFVLCDREQELLLPPSLRDWLAEDHLAWCVLDAVEQIDLSGVYGAYRADGWGRAAFDPRMMVALLLYAYAIGERSSRGIERRCREDVAFRVIMANQVPDHATIARFRARHEQALAEMFTEILALCVRAGLVSVGLVALDGTRICANAAQAANRTHEAIREEVERILAEAGQVDAAEDERFGDARGVMSFPPGSLIAGQESSDCGAVGKNWRPSRPKHKPPTRRTCDGAQNGRPSTLESSVGASPHRLIHRRFPSGRSTRPTPILG